MASKRSTRNRSVSPPASKRLRVQEETLLHPSARDDSLTIYSWNVNGITPFLQQPITSFFHKSSEPSEDTKEAQSSLRDFLRRHEWPQLLFIQEVKINPDDRTTIRAVENAVRRPRSLNAEEPDYEAHFCLPSDKHNARGFGRKVYGVCSIVRKDFQERHVQRIRPVEWDKEGRFLVIETQAHGHFPALALFNIYAVNGTDNPYRDSDTGRVIGTRHDRKLEVHRRLRDEVRELQAHGFEIILAGDMNIARKPIDGHPNLRTFPKQHCVNRADFESKFIGPNGSSKNETEEDNAQRAEKDELSLGMIDTFRYLHPEKEGYTYYPRTRHFGESCDRVDMILISDFLGSSLTHAGMHETPGDRGPSDHVPLFANLKFSYRNHAEQYEDYVLSVQSVSQGDLPGNFTKVTLYIRTRQTCNEPLVVRWRIAPFLVKYDNDRLVESSGAQKGTSKKPIHEQDLSERV